MTVRNKYLVKLIIDADKAVICGDTDKEFVKALYFADNSRRISTLHVRYGTSYADVAKIVTAYMTDRGYDEKDYTITIMLYNDPDSESGYDDDDVH